jgi:hypothetical protein
MKLTSSIGRLFFSYAPSRYTMTTANDSLLMKFRPTDSVLGVTRKTVKAMAMRLGVPETQLVHLALARLAEDTLPGYEADERTLTARQFAAVKEDASKHLPKGKVQCEESLFS